MKLKLNKNGSEKLSKTAIAFYVLAAVLLFAFLLTAYNVTVYIQGLLAAGSISLTKDWTDIILYYVNNSASQLVFSALLFGMGYAIQLLKNITSKDIVTEPVEEIVNESEEIVLEESEIESNEPAEEII